MAPDEQFSIITSGVRAADLVDPVLHRAAMLEQAGAHRFGADVGAHAGRRVVVELEIPHAVFADEPLHRVRRVFARDRRAEVQMVAPLVGYARAVTAEERAVG